LQRDPGHINPTPTLAQTRLPDGGQAWHSKTEFYSFHFRSITGVTEFSKQVAPGQADMQGMNAKTLPTK